MGEELFLKLRPIASRDDGHFDNFEKIVQQRRHFEIKSRFTFRERTVKIEDNQLLHFTVHPCFLRSQLAFPTLRIVSRLLGRIYAGTSISNKRTVLAGRNTHDSITAGKSHTSPLWTEYVPPPCSIRSEED